MKKFKQYLKDHPWLGGAFDCLVQFLLVLTSVFLGALFALYEVGFFVV